MYLKFLDNFKKLGTKPFVREILVIDLGLDCVLQLKPCLHFVFLQLLKKEEDTKDKPVETACSQLINCLVENVLKLESVVGNANYSPLKLLDNEEFNIFQRCQ